MRPSLHGAAWGSLGQAVKGGWLGERARRVAARHRLNSDDRERVELLHYSRKPSLQRNTPPKPTSSPNSCGSQGTAPSPSPHIDYQQRAPGPARPGRGGGVGEGSHHHVWIRLERDVEGVGDGTAHCHRWGGPQRVPVRRQRRLRGPERGRGGQRRREAGEVVPAPPHHRPLSGPALQIVGESQSIQECQS
jgi:hypothetical protein